LPILPVQGQLIFSKYASTVVLTMNGFRSVMSFSRR
jgi:hypothetical protein